MNAHFISELNRSRLGVSVFLAVTVAAASAAPAAWSDRHPGQDVVVHYVRLTGRGFDNKWERDFLQMKYDACSERNRREGRAVTPLPEGGVPKEPAPTAIQIYYSANRTLTVTEGKIYEINFDTCALEVSPLHHLTLMSAAGLCRANLVKATAVGTCDERTHRDAPTATPQQPGMPGLPKLDKSRMTPHMRAQVEAAEVTVSMYQPRASSLPPTGETRQFAGEQCAVYRHDALRDEKCIARPESGFFIPASVYNGAIPGLLLQQDSPGMAVTAQQVTMDMKVSHSLFSLPPGVKVRSPSTGKP
jgi:hypothetical protein